MKPMLYLVMAIGLASSILPESLASDERLPDVVPKWEYQILTKEQIIELGKKDLTAGLNRLGEQGWELAAVEGPTSLNEPSPRLGHGSKMSRDRSPSLKLTCRSRKTVSLGRSACSRRDS